MKKLVLLAFVMLSAAPLVTWAQNKKATPVTPSSSMQSMDMSSPTAKGKWLLGPAITISSETEDDGTSKLKTSIMSLQPEIGYFIADNISVGLTLALGTEQVRWDGTATDKNSTFFVAPTLRYYLPIAPRFNFVGKLQVPVGSYKTTLAGGVDVDEKATFFGVQAIPAFAFFPSNKISVEMSWGGLYFQSFKQGGNTDSTFGLNLMGDDDFMFSAGGPSLGIKWHLGK